MDIKPTLVAAWFGAVITTLLFSIFFLIYLSADQIIAPQNQNFKLYSALPPDNNRLAQDIIFLDGRSLLVKNFFEGYKSPLAGLNSHFIEVADKYGLDWKLLPAIAMQESNGGKKVIKNSYNPFGYGIYGNLVIRFSSWEEAVEKVGKALKQDYLNQGLNTPDKIMAKYTPPSLKKGGDWARGVKSFMLELQ
ncbi:glucosaminidase domain-containing protein [Candidatus Daviesbacteria bacterium]|nr:glucosaminidase domain-containing protein [Candidatus Daviesbacteria bacterium]